MARARTSAADLGRARVAAIREALAFRHPRHARFPKMVENERALEINGLASYTGVVLSAPSEADATADVLDGCTQQRTSTVSPARSRRTANSRRPAAARMLIRVLYDLGRQRSYSS
jgi:hypothetical protein